MAINWRNVTLTDGSEDIGLCALSVTQLAELRDTDTMAGYWACSAAELDAAAEAHGETVAAGLSASEIDWTGFPCDEQIAELVVLARARGQMRSRRLAEETLELLARHAAEQDDE